MPAIDSVVFLTPRERAFNPDMKMSGSRKSVIQSTDGYLDISKVLMPFSWESLAVSAI